MLPRRSARARASELSRDPRNPARSAAAELPGRSSTCRRPATRSSARRRIIVSSDLDGELLRSVAHQNAIARVRRISRAGAHHARAAKRPRVVRPWSDKTIPTSLDLLSASGYSPPEFQRKEKVRTKFYRCRCFGSVRWSASSRSCAPVRSTLLRTGRWRWSETFAAQAVDRDPERAPVQRDPGGAGEADRHQRDPARHLALAHQHPAGVPGDCRARDGAPSRRIRIVFTFDGEWIRMGCSVGISEAYLQGIASHFPMRPGGRLGDRAHHRHAARWSTSPDVLTPGGQPDCADAARTAELPRRAGRADAARAARSSAPSSSTRAAPGAVRRQGDRAADRPSPTRP